MQSYEINQGKRKKAIKQVVKANVKTSKGHADCLFVTLKCRVLRDETDAGENLRIGFKSCTNHPDQRIDHNQSDKDQDKIS